MKIAFITSRFPYPIEKGDKLRAYHQLKYISQFHEVILIALSDQPVSETSRNQIEKLCEKVFLFEMTRKQIAFNLLRAVIKGIPFQVGYFTNRRIKSKIQEILIREHPDHIYAQLIRTGEYVRALPIRKTLDYMDVFSIGMQQNARSSALLLKPFYKFEAKKLAEYERGIYKDFDHHIIISAQDRERLPLEFKDHVRIISNGVDTSFFLPDPAVLPKYDFTFVGNMGYSPNIKAAQLLVNEIMPIVWRTRPEASVLIAGARPAKDVQNLAGERVRVSGWMRDIREAYATSKIFAAPIFSGIGQQNKILEAFAMQMPCVISTMVNNPIGAEDRKSVLLADDPETFAKSMLLLLESVDLRETIGTAARKLVCHKYSWEERTKPLQNVFMKSREISYTFTK